MSSILIKEEEGKQNPMYYVSRALTGVERNYQRVEKVAFVIVSTSRKLWLYFQAHAITILIDLPLKSAVQQLNTSGRLIKWSIELGEFDIEYKPKGPTGC